MPSPARSSALSVAVDLVVLTPRGGELDVLLARQAGGGRARAVLPSAPAERGRPLDDVARRLVRAAVGRAEARDFWLEQVAAIGGRLAHPAGADVAAGYLALAPLRTELATGAAALPGAAWTSVRRAAAILPARQRALLDAATTLLRRRVDDAPVAFRLLPPTFTLSELQQIYELLLGRRLHKASFRRALQGAALVHPTDEWRSEGRGRPAQLFRYAPKKKRAVRRGVRFDLE